MPQYSPMSWLSLMTMVNTFVITLLVLMLKKSSKKMSIKQINLKTKSWTW